MATNNIFFASSNQIYSFDPFANGFTFETWANFQSFGNASCSNINAIIPSLLTLRGDLDDVNSVAYPPASLGSSSVVSGNQYSLNLSGQTYGNGIYITNSSSFFATGTLAAHLAFDKITNGGSVNIWQSSAIAYSTTTGLYTGTAYYTIVNGTVIAGEWLEITLPQQMLLTSYSITSRSDITTQTPFNWILVATNNGGITWNQIDYENTIAFSVSQVQTFLIVNNTLQYNQYRIIITAVSPNNANGFVSINEWVLNAPVVNLLAYPPISLGSSTLVSSNKYTLLISAQTYGNGTYVTNSSSGGTTVYLAFDKITNGGGFNIWISSAPTYNTTTGIYIGTTYSTFVQTTSINGEWIEITLPSQIILTSYSITSRSDNNNHHMPFNWVVVATNDNGGTWTQIDIKYNITFTTSQIQLFTIINNSIAYNQYRIIVTAVSPGISALTFPGYVTINEWILFAGSAPVINSLYSFGITNAGRLCSYWNNNGPNSIIGNTTLSLNNWYHIAVSSVPSSGILRMFINGSLDISTTIPTSLRSNALGNYLLIGQLGNSCYTNAFLSNLRLIYGTAVYNSSSGFYLTNTPLTPYPTGLGIGECILLLRVPGTNNNTLTTLANYNVIGNNYTHASGGIITYYSVGGVTYAVHSFITTGENTFILNETRACDILIVAGGGGGGGAGGGGGGGAGGFQYFADVRLANGLYTVTVGTGGTGSSGQTLSRGTNGGNSIFASLPPSIGGGGGSTNQGGAVVASNGGSGGGSAATVIPGNGTPGQGYNGASTVVESTNAYGAGGGGGAGGAGILGNNNTPGNGGPGLVCSVTGNLLFYAGGGAGGMFTSTPIAYGGVGGGGSTGTNGTPNTGGGGGGSIGNNSQSSTAANGGSGIVIIRYVLNQFSITNAVTPPPCVFDNLSQAAISFGKGFYSLRRLLTSYTGPVVSLTRTSDNTRLDLYSDAYGNLGAYSNGSWISINNWLGASTGRVYFWYDQSGNGKPLGIPSIGSAPLISLTGNEPRLLFAGSVNSLESVPGLLASVTGTGTQYTYFAIWNKSDNTVASIMEHNASTNTNNLRASFYIGATAYGFSGWTNDNLAVTTYATNNRVNTVMRINNATTTNIYIKSNGIDSSGASSGAAGNNTNLSLNNSGFTVGRRLTDNQNYYNGFITMIAVFGNYITNTDANYLATL